MANLPSAAVVPCRLFCSSPSFVRVTRAKWIGSLLPLRMTIPATLHFSFLAIEGACAGVSCPEAAADVSKPIRSILYARCIKTSHLGVYKKKTGESATTLAERRRLYGSEDARKMKVSRSTNVYTVQYHLKFTGDAGADAGCASAAGLAARQVFRRGGAPRA